MTVIGVLNNNSIVLMIDISTAVTSFVIRESISPFLSLVKKPMGNCVIFSNKFLRMFKSMPLRNGCKIYFAMYKNKFLRIFLIVKLMIVSLFLYRYEILKIYLIRCIF